MNKRLARELRHAYDKRQVASGLRSWHTPRILPLHAWLNTLLEQYDRAPMRIHPLAASIIWEGLLKERAGDGLLNHTGLVRHVQQTWQRVNDWCIPVEDLQQHAASEDERLFAAIAGAYRQKLEQKSWIDHAQLAAYVTRLVASGDVAVPGRLVYAGFDRLAPAASLLFQAMRTLGSEVDEAPGAACGGATQVLYCADSEAELRAAGLWARRLLQADAGARIAIVNPGLEQDAAGAARLVREGLAPGWQLAGGDADAVVNVSYGRRLAEYPMVAIALLWLKWPCHGLTTRDVSLLLRNPFAGKADADGRCRLELVLRGLPDRSWRPGSLAGVLRNSRHGAASADWLQRVELVAAMEAQRSQPESPAGWAAKIDALLRSLGWPGEKPLDTAEFQLVNRWRELLNDLSRLDIVQPRMDLGEAVTRLNAFAGEAIYQPETDAGAVQLLGTLEAAGMEFDHLWVCHLDSQRWPPQASPLPLVSRALQRKLQMPDATPADTLDFSRRVLRRLTRSAPEVTLSWPRADQDLELEASPLLQAYSGPDLRQGEDPGWYAVSLGGDGAVERVAEGPPPPVRSGEKVGGGAAAVQRQIEEPFSAFAYGRLGVRDLEAVEPGLSASLRGNIIHRALHHLFRETPSSAEIGAWSADFARRIESAVDSALARPLRFADGVLSRLLAIERRRLRAMLRQFLDAEQRRRPFEVVSVEEPLRLSRYGVELDLRVDRVDRMADGSLLVVDYKTGAPKHLLTRDGDPKELQLVVYAAALAETGAVIGGLVLINVDSRDVVYRGAGGSAEWDRSPPELWGDRLKRWQQRVDAALAGFAAGDVRIDMGRAAAESRRLSVLSRTEELKRGR